MKTTYLSDVYDSFLEGISDYTFIAETEEEVLGVEGILFGYFKKARAKFYKCKKSLKLFEDDEGLEYFGKEEKDGEIINVELTDFEIMVLAHLMTVEYMKQQVLASEVVKQNLSDKDFKIYSQANQLRELNLLYRLIQRESKDDNRI